MVRPAVGVLRRRRLVAAAVASTWQGAVVTNANTLLTALAYAPADLLPAPVPLFGGERAAARPDRRLADDGAAERDAAGPRLVSPPVLPHGHVAP